MTRTRIAAVLAVGTLLWPACIPRVQQPEITLAGVRVASLGLSGGVVDIRLNVHNPNRFALSAAGLSYDIEFEDPDAGWIEFTEGRYDEELRIDAGRTAEIVIPVEFSYRNLGDIARGVLDRGAFDYRVSGSVDLRGPVRRNISYRHTGTVTPGGVR